jgi:hypothetical protein
MSRLKMPTIPELNRRRQTQENLRIRVSILVMIHKTIMIAFFYEPFLKAKSHFRAH